MIKEKSIVEFDNQKDIWWHETWTKVGWGSGANKVRFLFCVFTRQHRISSLFCKLFDNKIISAGFILGQLTSTTMTGWQLRAIYRRGITLLYWKRMDSRWYCDGDNNDDNDDDDDDDDNQNDNSWPHILGIGITILHYEDDEDDDGDGSSLEEYSKVQAFRCRSLAQKPPQWGGCFVWWVSPKDCLHNTFQNVWIMVYQQDLYYLFVTKSRYTCSGEFTTQLFETSIRSGFWFVWNFL